MNFNDSDFNDVMDKNHVVIIDFYADWCGPCKIMSPIFERLAHKYEGKAVFGRVNVDEANQTSAKYGIMSIPTFMAFKNGKPDDAIIGVAPELALEKMIKKEVA